MANMHPNTSGLIPLTSERAKRIAAEVKERKRIALLYQHETIITDDETRKKRVLKQIDLLLTAMEAATDIKERLRVGAALERLWKLVQPTAGALRPGRGSRRADAPEAPTPMPQAPTTPANPPAQ